MDDNSLQLLEYHGLLELVAAQAQSEPGAVRCLNLRPDLTAEQILESWTLIDEAKHILGVEGAPPLSDFSDVTPLLDRLKVEGVMLRPTELLLILRVVRTSRLVRTFLLEHDTRLLGAVAVQLPLMKELEQSMLRSIGPDGEILDTASPELARIRREQGGLRDNIKTRLTELMRSKDHQHLIQDQLITRRGGRYVIPVRTSLRRDLPGLVHDYSASGATAYLEPLDMVEDNNRVNYLKRKEKHEIDLILGRLSAMAARESGAISLGIRLLSDLDVIFAQAAFSRRQKSRAPFLVDQGDVVLKEARHPLLLARLSDSGHITVPLDITVADNKRTVVVSGINAGGKTVALKTIGMLALMAKTGLHLPVAEGSRMPLFGNVLAVIGDEQDIKSDLSTFSGHIRRLSRVLEQADATSLVILDELGTGTDPSEGAALALAVLENLTERGAWVLTATHYHLLKAWAYLNGRVENAAVRIDTSGRPTYGLDYGSPGFSAGITMARDLGLDSDIVAKAEQYLDEGQKRTLTLMRKFEEEKTAFHESRTENEFLAQELSAALTLVKRAETTRGREYAEEIKTLRLRVNQVIARAEKDFEAVRRQLPLETKPTPKLRAAHQDIKRELREVVPAPPRQGEKLSTVRVGDWVRIENLGLDGRIKSVNQARQRAEVELEGKSIQVPWADLTKGTKAKRAKKQEIHIAPSPVVCNSDQVNLLGLTVDEALPEVEKLLDQAFLGGVKRLAIIHGIGTGRLRQAVRGYLAGDSRVKDFGHGDRRSGGEGVTMVELND
jgi:DNA mismatch repair protein MutS2